MGIIIRMRQDLFCTTKPIRSGSQYGLYLYIPVTISPRDLSTIGASRVSISKVKYFISLIRHIIVLGFGS